jgi:hypothetical protein
MTTLCIPVTLLRRFRTPVLVSSALGLPFVVLELVNRRSYHEGFPIPLFGLLWLLPLSFMLIAPPLVRNLSARRSSPADRLRLLAGVLLLILVAGLWFGIISDQMPCFLGVPRCD